MKASPSLPESLRHRFGLLGRLGTGGMGEVLAVRDALRGEDVALKLLRRDRKGGDARLVEEFSVLASLDHPGIVGVREIGVAGDTVYMTSSLLDGRRLDVYLDSGPPAHEVDGVLEDVLGTLAWLHGHGLVHGDIKPGNVLVLEGGDRPWPMLIDFGLAHLMGAAGAPLGGTPGYMAPELLGRGRTRPSVRSDLYALGRCFASFAEEHRDRAAAGLVRRMIERDMDARPVDADEALHALGRAEAGHRLGGRGPLALWGHALEGIRDGVMDGGNHRVALPGSEDGRSFAHALKTSLELAGHGAVVVPEDRGAPLDIWRRLLTCLGRGEPGALETDRMADSIHAPEGHAEALDAFAFRVVEALRAAGPGSILVPGPEQLSGPDGHVLRRCLEGGVGRALVLLSGPDPGKGEAASGLDAVGAERHVVPAPGKRQVRRFLRLHGVDDHPDDGIMALVSARAERGAARLKSLLGFWAESGVLQYDGAGRWKWDPDRDPAEVDAPDLDGVWQHLWASLAAEDRDVVGDLVALGGRASATELGRVGKAGVSMGQSLTRLAQAGWTRGGHGARVVLPAMAADRFRDGRLRPPKGDPGRQGRALEILRETADGASPGRQRALAVLLEDAELHQEASKAWAAVADGRLGRLDTAGAGEAHLHAAKAAMAGGQAQPAHEVFSWVEKAARMLEVVGDEPGLDEAMALARQMTGNRGTATRVRVLEAHVALHRGTLDLALERLALAREGLDPARAQPAAVLLDMLLIEGSALAGLGRIEEAAIALREAADRAEALGDLHGAGRVSNNLGNVHLRLGQGREAAEAYARSAAIKERTGDARGRRIAQSNRVLALRLLGELAEAAEVMADTLALAERLGDRRGIVTAHLVLTLLALDLGQLPWAELEISKLEGLDPGSRVAGLNVTMARARLALARGDAQGAELLARELVQEARGAGLASMTRAAWGLEALARLRQPPGGLSNQQLVAMDEAARTLATEARGAGDVDHGLLLDACRVYALALAGSWDEAREKLDAAVGVLDHVTCDAVGALGLLGRAARLLGEEEARAAVADAADQVMRARWRGFAALRGNQSLGPLPAASLAVVRRALDLGDLLDGSPQEMEADPAMDPMLHGEENMMETTRDPALHALTVAVGGLPEGGFALPESWARALRRVSGADAATLVAFSGPGVEVLARAPEEGGDAGRTAALAEPLRGRAEPFVGRGRDGGLEVLGLPLRHGPGDEPVGAAMMTWPDGTADSPEAVVGRLTHAAKVAALVVDRHRLLARETALGRQVREATEESALMAAGHSEEISRLRDALHHTQTEVELRYSYDRIIHRSRAMRRVLRTLDKVTDSDVTVLVLGESGVGKEVLSRALHLNGPRSGGPFVAENCGAIPSELFESVFFGHVRGAFTGASSNRRGLVEQAQGGTLFLDEVAELRPEHQVKLLRVLQERTFRPVGGAREMEADVRLVAATNRDLEAMVEAGTFREDLYYRLSVVRVEVPPLRERREDIMPLVTLFLDRESERQGSPCHLSPGAADLLTAYDWPGNVREVENEILRASVLAEDHTIAARHLSPRVRGQGRGPRGAGSLGGVAWDGQAPLDQVLGSLERQVITQALAMTRGKKASAARMLGISRPGLDAKLARHGIDVARFRASERPNVATT